MIGKRITLKAMAIKLIKGSDDMRAAVLYMQCIHACSSVQYMRAYVCSIDMCDGSSSSSSSSRLMYYSLQVLNAACMKVRVCASVAR
jgi:hypothetical protein